MDNLNLFSIAAILVGISSFSMSIFLFVTSWRKKLTLIWAFYTLTIAIWGFGGFRISFIKDYDKAFLWWQITYIGIIFMPVLLIHFVYTFLNIQRKKFIIFLYSVSLFLLIINFTQRSLFLRDVRFVFDQFYWPGAPPGPFLYFFIFVFIFGLISYSHYELIKVLFTSKDNFKKKQIMYFLIGAGFAWAGGFLCFLPCFRIDVYPYGTFTAAFYPFIFTYAIVKYRLMDVKIAITRAGVFAFVYLFVLGIPFWIGYKYHLWQYAAAITAVLATFGPFAFIYFSNKAERKLLAEDFRKYDVLKRFASTLSRMKDIDLERLLKLIIYRLIKTMGISNGTIYLNDEEENKYIQKAAYVLKGNNNNDILELPQNSDLLNFLIQYHKEISLDEMQAKAAEINPRRNYNKDADNNTNHYVNYRDIVNEMQHLNAALIIPSFLDKELIGFLVLSEKISGKPYSETDIEVLTILARQASLAILSAISVIKLKNREREIAAASRIVEIGNLASSTGHQLGNVLNNIMNAGYMIKDNDAVVNCFSTNPEARAVFDKIIDAIITNATDGDKIIEEIRDYSRPESEKQLSLVNLKTVLNKTIEMLYIQINKFQNIDIAVNISQDIPDVMASAVGLQNVFVNMFNNAYDGIQEMKAHIKLHPELGLNDYKGKIEVKARSLKGNVEIHIIDNGKGMTPDIVRKLFTPHFTTKASSDKRKEMKLSGGTGIGLYIIRFLVNEYGGSLDLFKTEPLKGTDFLIQLPIPRK